MTSAIIVGGGIIGLAVAWRAAQRGISVTLADPQPGQGATHAAAGMLMPGAEAAYAERELLALGVESLRRYPEFASELTSFTGEPTGFRREGTLQVAYDADDLAVLDEMHELRASFGVPAQRLTARECRTAEPMLTPDVRGGLLSPGDAWADPRLLTQALLAALTRAGVTVTRQAVTEVLVEAGRASGVRLAGGASTRADQVVLAAGWNSGTIGGLPPGTVPPLRPVKGQILRLRADPAAPVVSHCIRGVVRGFPIYLVPRESGELVVGATQEEMGPDTRVTAGAVWQLLRDARTLVPAITELDFAEATVGLRPGTPDNAPVLGPSGLPGLVLATGHFRSGVLLAPVTADTVAEYLATQHLAELAAPFTMARLAGQDRAKHGDGQPAGSGSLPRARQAGQGGPEGAGS